MNNTIDNHVKKSKSPNRPSKKPLKPDSVNAIVLKKEDIAFAPHNPLNEDEDQGDMSPTQQTTGKFGGQNTMKTMKTLKKITRKKSTSNTFEEYYSDGS
jgi:hypothetical protein